MRLVLLAACTWVALSSGCAGTTPSIRTEAKPALTIFLANDAPTRAQVVTALRKAFAAQFALSIEDFPNPPVEPADLSDVEARLAAARKSYINADFAPCLQKIGEDSLADRLLSEGQRELAARVLFWRIACHVGAGHLGDARAQATRFATHDLPVPADVEAAAPEVEAVIAQAERAVGEAPRIPLRLSVPHGTHAAVSLDGRREVCATPCTVDVHPGDHMIRVDADGFVPESRTVRADAPQSRAQFELTPADPKLASRQWAARRVAGRSVDDAESLGLLSIAARSRTLAVLDVDAAAADRALSLRGALALDGVVAVRSERRATSATELPSEAPAAVRDLLVRGRLVDAGPPLWKRPLFWTVVGVAIAAAAGTTALLLFHPDTQTSVRF
jgi:hypothetical protein